MRIVLLRGACDNGRTCPNINSTDRASYVIQGYLAPSTHAYPLAPGQAVVEIPLSLLPELTSPGASDGLFLTGRGTILVRGSQVIDPDALAELNLPPGENAVEIPRTSLPELETTDAG